MKKYGYSISVDNPCTQKWSEMTLSEKGKFCSHCSKDIIDFSKLTDKEIIKLIESSEEKLCGKFNHDQLNRLLVDNEIQTSKPRLYKILAGFLMFLTAGSTVAQTSNAKTEIVTSVNSKDSAFKVSNNNLQESQTSDTITSVIKGRVLDSVTKEPLIEAFIHIKNTGIRTVTDIDGNFELIVLYDSKDTINIEYYGYESLEFLITKRDLPISKDFFLVPNSNEAEIVIMGYVTPSQIPKKEKKHKKIKPK